MNNIFNKCYIKKYYISIYSISNNEVCNALKYMNTLKQHDLAGIINWRVMWANTISYSCVD